MPCYKVLERCYIGGILRDPGGKHDPYCPDKKLDPCPKALELIKGKPGRPAVKPEEKHGEISLGKKQIQDIDIK